MEDINEIKKQLQDSCNHVAKMLSGIAEGSQPDDGDDYRYESIGEYIDRNSLGVTVTVGLPSGQGAAHVRDYSIAVTLGGPNIYIRKHGVYGYWGVETAVAALEDSVSEQVSGLVDAMAAGTVIGE